MAAADQRYDRDDDLDYLRPGPDPVAVAKRAIAAARNTLATLEDKRPQTSAGR